MSARYSDRFFGPDAESGSSADQGRAEEIELVEPMGSPTPSPEVVESPPAPDRPWHASGAARWALVATLALGAVAGAYGWDVWRDRQNELIAQSTVDVSSNVLMLGAGSSQAEVSLNVRIANNGAHAVTLTGIQPLDTRLEPLVERLQPVEIEPGDDFARVLEFGLDCGSPRSSVGSGNEALMAQLTTIDRAEHEVRLTIEYAGLGYSPSLTEQCSYSQEGFQALFPEVRSVATAPTAVTSLIIVHSGGGAPERLLIEDVSPQNPAFGTSWELAPTDEWIDNSPTLIVTWSVAQCERALTAGASDMMLDISGRMPTDDGSSVVPAYPSPDLTAELVRLSERACG